MNIINTKQKAVIYVRVSSDEQVDGTSLEFQESECRKYCERKDFEVAELFKEKGESAKDLSLNNRHEFLKAIEYCRKHKGNVQAFVVLRVSRFARNTEDHLAVRKILAGYGTNLHSVTEAIGNKPQEKVFEVMAAAFSEYDNAIRKQQCTDGMNEKINQGIWPWKPPLGYECGYFRKRDQKKNEPDKSDLARFPIIKRLLMACLEQKIKSTTELAILAKQWGLTNRKGVNVSRQSIDHIFANEFYAGILKNPFTGKKSKGRHEPMISQEEFNQIQLIRKGMTPTMLAKRLKNNPDFPLTRDIKCAVCGVGLSGSHPRGNGGIYSYYHCHNKKCLAFGKNIPQKELHEDFIALLGKITPKQDFLDLFKEIVLDVWRTNGAMLEDAVKRQDLDIQQLKQKKIDYVEMIRKGTVDEKFGKELIDSTDNEIASKQITMRENNIDKLDIESAVIYASNFISDLPRIWTDLDVDTKKRFQKLIFPEGISFDKKLGFGTAKLGLIYELIGKLESKEANFVVPRGIEPLFSG
jgi:site-specific DNA recombinase